MFKTSAVDQGGYSRSCGNSFVPRRYPMRLWLHTLLTVKDGERFFTKVSCAINCSPESGDSASERNACEWSSKRLLPLVDGVPLTRYLWQPLRGNPFSRDVPRNGSWKEILIRTKSSGPSLKRYEPFHLQRGWPIV